jgi:hypothetical protein
MRTPEARTRAAALAVSAIEKLRERAGANLILTMARPDSSDD